MVRRGDAATATLAPNLRDGAVDLGRPAPCEFGGGAMLKGAKLSLVVGAMIFVGSIVVAFAIRVPAPRCSYSVPPGGAWGSCATPDNVPAPGLRIGIGVAGLVVAVIVVVIGRLWMHRRAERH